MGPGREPPAQRHARGDPARSADRGHLRVERLRPGLRRRGRLSALQPSPTNDHEPPDRVPGPQRFARRAGGHAPQEALQPGRQRRRSLRGDPGLCRHPARRTGRRSSSCSARPTASTRRDPCWRSMAASTAPDACWKRSGRFWKRNLGGVYVETPDASVNLLVNHWLLYQTLACRFWGRSGFYQSGGAYGFRDQLQDSLALLYECPWLTRQHLLPVLQPPVPEWRCPALVASAVGPRRPHAHLGRLPVAALRGLPLRRGDGRHRHPGRTGRIPRGAAAGAGGGKPLWPAARLRPLGPPSGTIVFARWIAACGTEPTGCR